MLKKNLINSSLKTTELLAPSGQISIASDINRDPLLDDYELVIEAMDGGLPRKSNVTIVTVHCTVNHPPIILQESTHMRIKENTKPGTVVGTVKAYDPDHNQMLMFYSDDGDFDGISLFLLF